MTKYPKLDYSMNAVRQAGRRLAGKVDFRPDARDEAIEIFSIANSWRDSHIYPMQSVRASVRQHMRHGDIKGDMASRPKRMSSIRRKLATSTVELHKMQDLAGCRAIVGDIASVNALLERIHDRFPHDIRKEWRFIQEPKPDGYRSHHIAFKFKPRRHEDEHFEGREVELQIRTRLQHSWATAVEAVSLYRGEDLKHHKGDHEWLRLFELSSAEFAHIEQCPPVPGLADRDERIRELKDLSARLGAVSMLEDIKAATHFAENFVQESGRYYLLRYKPDHTVKIETYGSTFSATTALAKLEQMIEAGECHEKVVLVEVGKIDKLRQMYPNYFGDVGLFVANLKFACSGKPGVEYTVAPQQVVKPKELETPDWGALRRRYTRWIERR